MEHAGRILLTGASGFLAKNLLPVIRADGYEITCFSASEAVVDGVTTCGIDLRNRSDLRDFLNGKQFDFVLHMGAISNPRHTPVTALYETNILGLKNLLDEVSLQKTTLTRFYFFSSSHVYGSVQANPIEETAVPAPNSDYGLSKFIGEQICELYAARLPITVLRLFNIIGRGQGDAFIAGKLAKAFVERAPTINLHNVTDIRDFIDVRDFSEIIRRLLLIKPNVDILNICQQRTISVQDLIDAFVLVSGYRPEICLDSKRESETISTLLGSKLRLESYLGSHEIRPLDETVSWIYADPQFR